MTVPLSQIADDIREYMTRNPETSKIKQIRAYLKQKYNPKYIKKTISKDFIKQVALEYVTK